MKLLKEDRYILNFLAGIGFGILALRSRNVVYFVFCAAMFMLGYENLKKKKGKK